MFSNCYEKKLVKSLLGFLAGFALGQCYYILFLKDISFLGDGYFIGLILSILLGVCNAVSIQVQCISLLLLPMYCGKAGRGVLKAVVLTYVVAGPITNMGLNAKEVVRVFACSTQLSYNLTKIKYARMYKPLNKALLSLRKEVDGIKDAIRSIRDVISPIELEIEGMDHLQQMKAENDLSDALFDIIQRSQKDARQNHLDLVTNESGQYEKTYLDKMEIRCENQLSHTVTLCLNAFSSAYEECNQAIPAYATMICWPLMLPRVCNVKQLLGPEICNSRKQLNPGLGIGYAYLKKVKRELTSNLTDIKLQHKVKYERELQDVQDAKETGDRVLHAFHEKFVTMELAITTVNFCLALLFLRIAYSAQSYHDMYLTSIDFDNVYITGYFKRIDLKRRRKDKFTLLPLKKMERNRYVDVLSTYYLLSERKKLLCQILKVMLEAVTATTFVMLDRLFYEALDVVRMHAKESQPSSGVQDLEIKVESKGLLSSMVRRVLEEMSSNKQYKMVSNEMCLPRPRAMPSLFYFKIYGGYIWILLLVFINPYTMRLRRLICSHFYPVREKQRILHLYNDILKKRVKMDKTLRRRAVQSVRAHYLSGENLLSLRIRFPQMLGWLEALPVARMKCLICEETAPRDCDRSHRASTIQGWHSCVKTRCPFVYCEECWREVGSQCLACDPALAELSDIDSLSDDNPPRH
ncbi:protein sneaky isoform X1 [Maniola jurtina]|uniref:protein sneaky isoform X1 n=1 Tax=Maniola jurtina TaxID=191418 RepID=UPI001E686087|nr:protein sneaky isoform X1 [Maniola jurtina]